MTRTCFGVSDEWDVSLEKVVTLEELGSYPPRPNSRKAARSQPFLSFTIRVIQIDGSSAFTVNSRRFQPKAFSSGDECV